MTTRQSATATTPPRTPVGVVVLLTLVLNGALPSNAVAQAEPTASVDELLAAIERQESGSDGYAPQLGELYFSLGLALGQQNAVAEALQAFQTAMQIERVNHGLNAIGQTPFLFAVADSHLQLGDRERATDALYAAYRLAINHYGEMNAALLPTLDKLLAWQLEAYHNSATAKLGFKHLVDADKIAAHQLNVLLANSDSDSQHTATDHYRRVIEVNYTIAEHLREHGLPSDNGFSISTGLAVERTPSTHSQASYRNGKTALEQIVLGIERSADSDPQQLAEAVATLGDWYLVFAQQRSAEQAYRLAYELTTVEDDESEESEERDDSDQSANPDRSDNTDTPEVEASTTFSALGEQLFALPRAIQFGRTPSDWVVQTANAEVDDKGRVIAVEWPAEALTWSAQQQREALKLVNEIRYRPSIGADGSRSSSGPIAVVMVPELVALLSAAAPAQPSTRKGATDAATSESSESSDAS